MNVNMIKDYTQLYNNILLSLNKDEVPQTLLINAAKKITDAIWDLCLVLDSKDTNLVNTRATVIEVINNI